MSFNEACPSLSFEGLMTPLRSGHMITAPLMFVNMFSSVCVLSIAVTTVWFGTFTMNASESTITSESLMPLSLIHI